MSDKLRRALMFVLVCVFLVSAVFFVKYFMEYRKGDKIYETAKEFVVEAGDATTAEEEKEERVIDFASLQAVNEDVFGWITIPETGVDYPLLDGEDNKYYLNRTYDGQWSSYGSIFLEFRNTGMDDRHVVLYGHNMMNKSMFGALMDYKEQDFVDVHDTVEIILPDRTLIYHVFSAYTAHVDSPTYYMSFADDAVFQQMIDHMKANSVIASDITPTTEDQILTLSTCTPAGAKKYRFVVNAVLAEEIPKETNITE